MRYHDGLKGGNSAVLLVIGGTEHAENAGR